MLFPFQLIPPCLITTCCCKQPYLIFPGSSFQCCSMAESCEKGLGMSQSHSNSALDYSGDTFESFSEEEESQARCWCCTEDLGSSSSQAGQSPAEEESEAVERAATGKWMDVKNKDTGIRPDKFAITAPAAIPAFSPEELDALRSFCSSRISRMQQEQAGKCRKLQWKMPARKSESGNCCDVPAQLLNRILLENTRQAVKQVTEAEIHETSTCPECQHKEAELARAAFLRHKKNLLESALIQEKLEEHLYSRDMLTLLGEALRSLPKPSEDLWQKLKDQGMENQNQP
ncbi:PREDICTED: uncharacterized protein C8orf48 homolog [Sturnus vulgaris]|uniref:uncharacterized protein C8orf48 homolog n=1 Tax=Sturnus vulgaris TaxID=9172 RepID=UPI00071AA723|nr:PREDICTED: uncharacterized protein C8orf48 homolog [Sturnus vulgaris]